MRNIIIEMIESYNYDWDNKLESLSNNDLLNILIELKQDDAIDEYIKSTAKLYV